MRRSRAWRIYGALLRLYPREYRERFGAGMVDSFVEELEDATGAGRWAVTRFLLGALKDLSVCAAAEHQARLMSRWRSPERRSIYQGAGRWALRLESAHRDVRLGLRSMRRRPLSAAATVVALGLGIGLTATAFSIVYGTLFRGLPFEDSERLVQLSVSRGGSPERDRVAYHDYVEWQKSVSTLEPMAAWAPAVVSLSDPGGGAVEFVPAALIEAEAFRVLGVSPHRGRLFAEEDRPAGPGVALIGYDLWRRRFGGRTDVIGRRVRVNLRRFSPGWSGVEEVTIIGVMPAGFAFPVRQSMWLPLRLDADGVRRGEGGLDVVGRLAPSVDIDAARAELVAIGGRLAAEYPESNRDVIPRVDLFIDRNTSADFKRIVLTILAGAILVLLVACANVANLLLVSVEKRTREMALRRALGAARGQLAGQLLTETLLLAVAGATLGIALAFFGTEWFAAAWNRYQAPAFWWHIKLDLVPLAVAGLLALATALLAGVAPALRASRSAVTIALKGAGRSLTAGPGKLGRYLVTGEIALTTALLMATGLTLKSVLKLSNIDYGVATTELFTTRVGLWESDYPDAASRARFWGEIRRRVESHPGVTGAALASGLPLDRTRTRSLMFGGPRDSPREQRPTVNYMMVSEGYFEVLGVAVRKGRDFYAGDRAGGSLVAIVNESFVNRFLSDEHALGSRLRFADAPDRRISVVGVVPDLWLDGPINVRPEGVYIPLAQADARYMNILVRSAGGIKGLASHVRADIAAIDPHLASFQTGSVHDFASSQTWRYRVYAVFYSAFGFTALVMALLGLYGVISASVGQRIGEFGIRMALGARSMNIARLVFQQGLIQLAGGLSVGLLLAFWLTRGLAGILFEVDTWDGQVAFAIAALLILVGLAAIWRPASRAMRVQPGHVLHSE